LHNGDELGEIAIGDSRAGNEWLCTFFLDFRGRGLGRVLMDALIDVARRWGSERVFLEVRESNAAAISLYENSGFEVVGRTKGYFRNPREDALNMRLIVR